MPFEDPRRNGSLFEPGNIMMEHRAIARQTITLGYIYNNKQAQNPLCDWPYKKFPVS